MKPKLELVVPRKVELTALKLGSFSSGFNFQYFLQTNRHQLKGEKGEGGAFTISRMPNYLHSCISRVMTDSKSKLTQSLIIAGCVRHGLEMFEGRPILEKYKVQKEEFYKQKDIETHVSDLIDLSLNTLPLSLKGASQTGARNLCVSFNKELLIEAGDLAKTLGISTSAMIIICILHTLKEDKAIQGTHKKVMKNSLNEFWERIEIQTRITKVLMIEFKGG